MVEKLYESFIFQSDYLFLYNPSGDPDDYRMVGDLYEDDGISAYLNIVSDPHGTENLRTGAYYYVIPQSGMTFPFLFACAAQRYALIEQTAFADLGGLSDDYSRTVVYKEAGANFRSWVYFYPSEEPANLLQKMR